MKNIVKAMISDLWRLVGRVFANGPRDLGL